MSKRKSSEWELSRTEPEGRKGAGSDPPDKAAGVPASRLPSQASIRETVESVVVAFVLAFLFRTFEAEAFVIPTGSMAPTLMGRHKDVYCPGGDLTCPECGCQYQVSASDRMDNGHAQEAVVSSSTCPMCRYTANLAQGNPQHKNYITYNGDRILVGKFPYDFGEPKRWDVVVFKFPGDTTVNYIKRLVGLPGETVRIRWGNIWIRKGDGEFEIARKPPEKLLAVLQPVFDNDFAPAIACRGWPARWQPLAAGGAGPGDWSLPDATSFQTDGKAATETWIRYQHRVPSYQQWQDRLTLGALPAGEVVPPQLISDFTAYNTGRDLPRAPPDCSSLGVHWVGDLALQCVLDVQSAAGEAVFELVKGGRRFQCRIDVATGQATLGISGPDATEFHPTATTSVRGPGSHKIIFSNVDDELRLWVDGSVVAFDAPTAYDTLAADTRMPKEADLSPAGIAARGAAVKVSHIKLLRDLYYIADEKSQRSFLTDFVGPLPNLAEPETWAAGFNEENMNSVEFVLAPPSKQHSETDQFFVMGDNSAQSKDGRLWQREGIEYWVSRELLIGKAFFIYWPHSWETFPGTNLHIPLYEPLFGVPNFRRMHLVR